jgi:DNA-directed RNA polymerase specialized sigma24 family protein
VTAENAKKDPGPSLEADAKPVVAAPPSDVHLKTRLSGAELHAFLKRPDTQARIRAVVGARLDPGAPASLRDDLVQQANIDALEAKSPPRSLETATGWIGTVTARAIVNHFRRQSVHAKYLQRDVDVEELPHEPDEPPESLAPKWLLTEWLRPRVAGNPRDQETYELLVYKADTGKTHTEVAADHAMTEGALKSRIHALKTKYEPQWRRRQRMFLLLILFGIAAVVAAIVWLLLPRSDEPHGSLPPPTTPILDRVFGGSLPVSHPRPDDTTEPDAGAR